MLNAELREGIKDSLPVVLGYLPLGFAFGVLAMEAGMNLQQATAMSVLCFTGAGQYIAIGVMQAGGAVITAILANLLINQRYTLFASSMVPYVKKLPARWAAFLSYGLTDETYAVAMNRYRQHEASIPYMAGLNLTAHISWIGSTILGAVLGGMISNTEQFGLGFALPAMYISLLVLMIHKKSDALVAIIAAVLSLLIGFMLPGSMQNMSNIIIATLIAASLGILFDEHD